MHVEVNKMDAKQLTQILRLEEDHFNDVKSKRIAPAKLQQTFVAFANSDGGDLYIGIEDKDFAGERVDGFANQEEANGLLVTLLEETQPSVENVQIEFLEVAGKGLILHIAIPKSPKVHYTASAECYIRLNAGKLKIKGERITLLGYSKGAEPYEKKVIDSIDINEITESVNLKSYMERVETTLEPEKFLRKQRLLTKKDDEFKPNVACALLFDDEPQATLDTRCAVKIYRLRTTEKEYKREQLEDKPVTINGPIEQVILRTIDKVREFVDGASFHDGQDLIKLEYPSDALKEILVNAVLHRDYSLNDDIHVTIYDNRIEIKSPGKLPGYMTINNIYEERFSRNPNLVRLIHNLPNPLNHDIGEGLDTAKNELKKAGLIDPIFQELENSFVVTIRHQKIASIEDVVIKYLETNPKSVLSNKLVRQLSGEDDMQKVKLALQKLGSLGKIKPLDEKASAFNFKYVSVDHEG